VRLNLGCSDDRRAGYVNVDIAPPTDLLTDLRHTWPWHDGSIDEIYAKDVLEHIDNTEFRGNRGKIWVMNEAHRVLRSGGILEFLVPIVLMKDGRVNPGAFTDPTHVSFWTPDDKYYFCSHWNNPRGERGRLGAAYGITALFNLVKWDAEEYGQAHERRAKLHAILRAVK
jgi:hypothetical protein